MKNNNYDMKNLFENDSVSLPESLREENIVNKIKEEQVKQDKKKIKIFPKVVAVVAAAAIAVTCIAVFPKGGKVNVESVADNKESFAEYEAMDLGLPETELLQFKSKADVENYFLNIYKNHRYKVSFPLSDETGNTVVFEETNETFDALPNKVYDQSNDSVASAYGTDHSETNSQVEGVDEADIIKNDGRYIYTIDYDRFSIIDSQTMTVAYQTEIKPEDEKMSYSFDSMYLTNGNRLVLTGNIRKFEKPSDDDIYYKDSICRTYYSYSIESAVSIVYDISDKTAPKKINLVTQDGYLHSSRMVGNVLYTVSQYNVPLDNEKDLKNDCIPGVNGSRIDVSDIYATSIESDSSSYTILTSYDTADPSSAVNKVCVLGSCDNIYCTESVLFVTNSHPTKTDKSDDSDSLYWDDVTDIHAFSLDGTTVSYKASGSVPGSITDQYQMDHYDSKLRVTTNLYDYKKDVDVSSLYVLDASLKIIGKLENIAEDEEIKSTRFMGNTAYVVTFRNTDPLFVIDLTDPSKPQIKGEVKLPGFSEYLHPVGDGRIIGIGVGGTDEGANFNKVKISLFDVSDPTAPKETDSFILDNAATEAGFNPKAFIYDKETNTIGLPVYYYTYKGNDYIGQKFFFKMFTVNNDKICEEKTYSHGMAQNGENYWWGEFFRGIYIADKVYTITKTDIREYDRESCESLRHLDYAEYKSPYNETYFGIVD